MPGFLVVNLRNSPANPRNLSRESEPNEPNRLCSDLIRGSLEGDRDQTHSLQPESVIPNSSLNSYRPWLLKKSSLLATQLVLMVQFAMLPIITDKVQAIVLVNPGGLDKGGWLANMMIKSLACCRRPGLNFRIVNKTRNPWQNWCSAQLFSLGA